MALRENNQQLNGMYESIGGRSELSNREYLKEYLHVLALAFIFFLLLCVITFDPTDPSPFNFYSTAQNNNHHIINIFGPLGASVSDWCYQLFGLCSFLFLLVFLLQALNTFRRPKLKSRFYLRLFGYPQLLICYLGLVASIVPTINFRGAEIYSGGVIGFYTFQFLSFYLGKTGAIVLLSFGFISSLTLALGIRPLSSILFLLNSIPTRQSRGVAHTIEDAILKDETSFERELPITYPESRQQGSLDHLEKSKDISEEMRENKKIEKNLDLNFVVGKKDLDSLVTLLSYHKNSLSKKSLDVDSQKIKKEAALIEEKLATFGVSGRVVESQVGPVIDVHEFEPAPGIKVNKVTSLQDDLALGLKAQSLFINLKPGKNTLSIEVPSANRDVVSLREILESKEFLNQKAPLPMVLGKNIDGSPLIADLCSMPHLLVAGATGSGKSVCINTILMSLLISKTPKQLRLILIDPKMLELSNYNEIGHLLMPVVTEPEKAAAALKWAIQEMERRYKLMKEFQVRNILAYNDLMQEKNAQDGSFEYLPYIVVVVDELCDLMMTAPRDVEECIQRLAQKARAAGIHLILATQRPSVDVLTGVIKANLPCRLSFQVASRHDSRTIIESIGAERLLGMGDMLFLPPGTSKVTRAQCAYVNDQEINSVSDKLRKIYPAFYENDIMKDIDRVSEDIIQRNNKNKDIVSLSNQSDNETLDENTLYEKAYDFALREGTVSTSSIQREFRIGYNRAARLMDRMVKEGVVGQPEVPGKPRPVKKFKG